MWQEDNTILPPASCSRLPRVCIVALCPAATFGGLRDARVPVLPPGFLPLPSRRVEEDAFPHLLWYRQLQGGAFPWLQSSELSYLHHLPFGGTIPGPLFLSKSKNIGHLGTGGQEG